VKQLQVSTEYQYKTNGKEYYKVYVSRADGTMVRGSRTLQSYTGSTLKRICREMQEDINRGIYK